MPKETTKTVVSKILETEVKKVAQTTSKTQRSALSKFK